MNDYGPDLAYIHHAGFSEFAEEAAPGLLEILWKHGIRDGLVVEALQVRTQALQGRSEHERQPGEVHGREERAGFLVSAHPLEPQDPRLDVDGGAALAGEALVVALDEERELQARGHPGVEAPSLLVGRDRSLVETGVAAGVNEPGEQLGIVAVALGVLVGVGVMVGVAVGVGV